MDSFSQMENPDTGAPSPTRSGRGSNGGEALPSLESLKRSAVPLVLSGSLFAVSEARQTAAAARLAQAGWGIHVDIIDDSYPLGAGVDPRVMAAIPPGEADVHLMVRDPLRMLDEILPCRPAQVTVQLEDLGSDLEEALAAFAGRCRAAGAAPHLAVAPDSPRDVLSSLMRQVDGLLVMLSPPAAANGRADLRCLEGLPPGVRTLAVDGGVTPEMFARLHERGVDRAVMGRAVADLIG